MLTFLRNRYNIILICVSLFIYNDFCQYYAKDSVKYIHNKYSDVKSSFFTSVWCRGSNHSNRMCRFQNLCYRPISHDFVFFKSEKSYISGVPSDRFNPALVDFSSVENHNKMYFNYIELPEAVHKKLNIIMVEGNILIIKRFNPENLMHVFHDDLLPVFYTLRELFPFGTANNHLKITLAFADVRDVDPYKILYNKFLDTKPLYLANLDANNIFCFQQSYIGLNKYSTWYQYGFKEPQSSLSKSFDGFSNIIQEFRSYFYKQFNIIPHHSINNYAVLLTRKKNRKILNEEAVISAIQNHTHMEVLKIGLETHCILDIIRIISECKLLVGMHGALLILSLFLKPGVAILELFPYAITAQYFTPYKTISLFPGLCILYYFWENKLKENSFPHPENPSAFGGIYHLSETEQVRITETSKVLPKLCCYDPEWLYFIYQDTVIDIDSFVIVLKTAKTEFVEFNVNQSNDITTHLYPGEVTDVNCSLMPKNKTHNNQIYKLLWTVPWNVKFLTYDVLEYEVWIQVLDREEILAYLTKQLSFTITMPDNSPNFYVWIRCHIDGLVGPFNSDPLVCFDN